MKQNILAT